MLFNCFSNLYTEAIRERLFNYLTLSLDPDSIILAFADEE